MRDQTPAMHRSSRDPIRPEHIGLKARQHPSAATRHVQPSHHLKTANAINIEIPPALLALAAWLLGPYLAWVAYATTINAGVVAMN